VDGSRSMVRSHLGTTFMILAGVAIVAFPLVRPTLAGGKARHDDLSGTWVLDPGKSDDARAKLEKLMQSNHEHGGGRGGMGRGGMGGEGGMGGGMGRGGGRWRRGGGGEGGGDAEGQGGERSGGMPDSTRRARMERVLHAPERMVINDEDPEVRFSEDDRLVRILYTDSREVPTSSPSSDVPTVPASWKGRKLVYKETEVGRGDTEESYELSKDGHELDVTMHLTLRSGSVDIKRVYEKAQGQ